MGISEIFSKKMILSALATFAFLILMQNVLSGGNIQGKETEIVYEPQSAPSVVITEPVAEIAPISAPPIAVKTDVKVPHGRATPTINIPVAPRQFDSDFEACPAAVSKIYDELEFDAALGNNAWCKQKETFHGIRIGKTWGSSPRDVQQEWNKRSCNDIILNGGKPRTCNEKNGWKYLADWIGTRQPRLAQGSHSQITCGKDAKLSAVCAFENVVVDFGQASIRGSSRAFGQGFVRAHGKLRDPSGLGDMMIPGLVVDDSGTRMLCDEYENRPTFIMSHDDTDNLAHHMNDVTMVWVMGLLAGRRFNDSLFIHMDGIRRSGPAGGLHRLMHIATPDSPSTFNDYYLSWFQQIKKGVDYHKRKVCFKEIYFQPMPGLGWVWDGWSEVKPCAAKIQPTNSRPVPSPLFQSFNQHLRHSWQQAFGALTPPASGEIHVLLILRRSSLKKGGAGRVVANNDQLVTALQGLDLSGSTVPGARQLRVRVTARDFSSISFREQMSLVHSAHLLVGMHGAGINQFFNMAIGEPNCCGLIEMFPDKTMGYDGILGNQNMAKFLGLTYARYQVNSAGPHSPANVNVRAVVDIVKGMVDVLASGSGRICLNDVKDSVNSIVYANKNLHSNA